MTDAGTSDDGSPDAGTSDAGTSDVGAPARPGVCGAAAVSGAPVLLPEAAPRLPAADRAAVERLRAHTHAVLAGLPDCDVTVLVASGPRAVHDRARASLRPLGVVAHDVTLPVDADLVAHVTRLTQYPLALGGDLDVTMSVLARLVHAVRGSVPVLPLSLAPTTDGHVLVSVGASIVEALRDAGCRAAVVVAGDLSAALDVSSPRYLVDGAPDWDRRLVAAVREGDTDAVARLGPDEAARVHAHGWAPLAALAGVAAASRLQVVGDTVEHDTTRGVGRLTARFAPSGAGEPGAPFRRAHAGALRLPRDHEPPA